MKLPAHNYLELAGLFIVLAATMLQLRIVTELNSADVYGGFVRVEEKLNLIWFRLNDLAELENIPTNDDQIEWNRWLDSENNTIHEQSDLFNKIYAFIMILGSFLLVFGRWLEMHKNLKDKNKENP